MTATVSGTTFGQRIRGLFEVESRFWKGLAILLGVVSFLRGVRLPNLWTATQAMLSYDHGLVKRGMFGTTVGHWFHLEHYWNFVGASFVLLFVLMGLLVALTVRSGALKLLGNGEIVAVFFASYAITYLANIVGYLDIPLCILAILVLLIRNTVIRFVVAVPVCVVALLVHELFLLVFVPVILLTFVLEAFAQGSTHLRRDVALATVVALVAVGMTVVLSAKKSMTMEQAKIEERSIAARADFAVRDDVLTVLTRSTKDNMLLEKQRALHDPNWDVTFVACVVTVLPTVLLLLAAVNVLLHAAGANFVTRVVAYTASLWPLAMHVMGWDSGRFDAMVCISTFLVVLVLCDRNQLKVQLPAWYRNAAVATIALSMANGEGLMDSVLPNPYPFLSGAHTALYSTVHGLWTQPIW